MDYDYAGQQRTRTTLIGLAVFVILPMIGLGVLALLSFQSKTHTPTPTPEGFVSMNNPETVMAMRNVMLKVPIPDGCVFAEEGVLPNNFPHDETAAVAVVSWVERDSPEALCGTAMTWLALDEDSAYEIWGSVVSTTLNPAIDNSYWDKDRVAIAESSDCVQDNQCKASISFIGSVLVIFVETHEPTIGKARESSDDYYISYLKVLKILPEDYNPTPVGPNASNT